MHAVQYIQETFDKNNLDAGLLSDLRKAFGKHGTYPVYIYIFALPCHYTYSKL